MANLSRIFGGEAMINQLELARNRILREVAEAVEKTAVDAAEHAKAGHGPEAHGDDRFVSRSGSAGLIGSIGSKLTQANRKGVEGIIFATKFYAPFVELGTSRAKPYPFIGPAVRAVGPRLRKRLEAINI